MSHSDIYRLEHNYPFVKYYRGIGIFVPVSAVYTLFRADRIFPLRGNFLLRSAYGRNSDSCHRHFA